MTKNKFGGNTYDEWIEEAEEYAKRHREGLEVEASENFRSQAAWNDLERKYRDFAEYAKTGRIFKVVLFDLEGNLIPGKWIENQYGVSYRTSEGYWLNPSKAMNENTRINNNKKKGFYEGSAYFKVYYNHYDGVAYTKTEDIDNLIEVIDNGQ